MPTSVRTTWTPPSWRVRILVCVFLTLLHVFDALATLYFIDRGASELNPLAGYLMSVSDAYFILMKSVGVGLLTIVIAAGMSVPRISLGWKRFFWASLLIMGGLYTVLAAFHASFLFLTALLL